MQLDKGEKLLEFHYFKKHAKKGVKYLDDFNN